MKNKIGALLLCVVLLAMAGCDEDKKKTDPSAPGGDNPTAEQSDSLLKELNKRIASDPNNYTNYLDRAKYYGTKGEYDLAHRDVERALAADSTKSDVYLYKGELFWNQMKNASTDDRYLKLAYEEYKNCLRFDSLNIQCHLKKAGIDIAKGDYVLANTHINKVLMINESTAEAYYLRGRLYKAKLDTALAKSSYATAIEVDPNYYDAYIELGLLYAAQKSDLAKEYYNSAISIRPRSIEAWYNKAIFLQETGMKKKDRFAEAFACYDSILEIDPTFVAAHFNKGYIFLEYQQKYDSAAVYFTKAIGQLPSYSQAYYNRGLCYESMDKFNDAERDYRSALSYSPQYTAAAKALSRVEGK